MSAICRRSRQRRPSPRSPDSYDARMERTSTMPTSTRACTSLCPAWIRPFRPAASTDITPTTPDAARLIQLALPASDAIPLRPSPSASSSDASPSSSSRSRFGQPHLSADHDNRLPPPPVQRCLETQLPFQLLVLASRFTILPCFPRTSSLPLLPWTSHHLARFSPSPPDSLAHHAFRPFLTCPSLPSCAHASSVNAHGDTSTSPFSQSGSRLGLSPR